MSAAAATVSATTPDDEKKIREITEEKKIEEKLLSGKYATIA